MDNQQCPHCGPDKKYWRPECPHCKGTGIVKVEASNNVQLPAEVPGAAWNPNDKERDATTHAAIVASFMASAIHKLSTGCNYEAIEYDIRSSIYHFEKLVQLILPTEYATKLHEAQMANANFKTEFDLYKDEMAEQRAVNVGAIKLLKKFIERHEAGLLPDRFIYNEIKTFLDGTR
jgi:hypothetical protein